MDGFVNVPGVTADELAEVSQFAADAVDRMEELLNGNSENRFGWQVGDIRESTRTDLDETWALCNGADFDPAEYTTLAEHGPSLASMGQLRQFITVGAGMGLAAGGGWLALIDDSANVYASKDGFRTVSTGTGRWNKNGKKRLLRYVNGMWFSLWSSRSVSPATAAGIACSGGGDPTDWSAGTTKNLTSVPTLAANEFYPHELWYEDGKYWIAATQTQANPVLLWSADPSFELVNTVSVTTTKLDTASDAGKDCGFLRTEDWHVFYGSGQTICYAPADDPLAYTVKTFSFGDALTEAGVSGTISGTGTNMACANGRFCRVYRTSTKSRLILAYTDDLAADVWQAVVVDTMVSYSNQYRCFLTYVPERKACVMTLGYLATGNGTKYRDQGGLVVIPDPFGEGRVVTGHVNVEDDTTMDYVGFINNSHPYLEDVLWENGLWTLASGTVSGLASQGVVRVPMWALPRESPPHGYKYIKVKEVEPV